MMSKRDHAKIILLEHATAKSAVERIQGFLILLLVMLIIKL